jgi:hypothetical protein
MRRIWRDTLGREDRDSQEESCVHWVFMNMKMMSLIPKCHWNLQILGKYHCGACPEKEYVRQEENDIWHSDIGSPPQLVCMVASGEKLASKRHRRKNIYASENSFSRCCTCPQCVLTVLHVSEHSCREVCVQVNTEVPSLCLLHSDTWLFPLWAPSSATMRTVSW